MPGAPASVLHDGHAVDGRWGMVACTLPPGWGGPPQHIHRAHNEAFFILTGTVKFTSGREDLIATPGSLVTAPIGDPHTFANADAQAPASLVCTITPERYIGYFKELMTLRPGPSGMLDPNGGAGGDEPICDRAASALKHRRTGASVERRR